MLQVRTLLYTIDCNNCKYKHSTPTTCSYGASTIIINSMTRTRKTANVTQRVCCGHMRICVRIREYILRAKLAHRKSKVFVVCFPTTTLRQNFDESHTSYQESLVTHSLLRERLELLLKVVHQARVVGGEFICWPLVHDVDLPAQTVEDKANACASCSCTCTYTDSMECQQP